MSTIDNHGECVVALAKAGEETAALYSLALDMGRLIRRLDETGEHSEFWTQDGGYIIDGRFPK